jgi:hypothetical protein
VQIEFRRIGCILRITAATAFCGWLGIFSLRGLGAEVTDVKPGSATNRTNAAVRPVTFKPYEGPRKIGTGLTNLHGQPIMASCSSCHATARPNMETRHSADLDQFHQGLKYRHGNLTCLSCHNAANYDTLRLADSRAVQFSDVMTLCSQCHGPQRRDYDMGLHGGMNGHWDLTKGGRTRNICVQCHDPHAPAFPLVMPVFPPRDRISVPQEKATKH